MTTPHYQTLRLILGDQLNARHSWFQTKDETVLYLIAELHQETGYVTHHVQKVCAFFAAMQAFAGALQRVGHQVCHLTLDETKEDNDLPDLLLRLIRQHNISTFEFQRPDEYRLYDQLHTFAGELSQLGITCREYDSEHFLLPFSDIADAFPQGKSVLMEHFYRRMRKRFNILMDGDRPIGGKWNYDQQNRQSLKPRDIEAIPTPMVFHNPVTEILERLQRHQVRTIGTCDDTLLWPVNRRQAKQLLTHFCETGLPFFGRFQDAMTEQSPHAWSLYHSRLSFAMNTKMLHPMQVIRAALEAFEANSAIDIAQAEGFLRQILGWREFVRGIYWGNMPGYKTQNALNAQRKLPDFFWTGNTRMACLRAAIRQSLDFAYAHHIQRLMVTGNFCLLAGIEPDEVDNWYLGIYVDAIEWVEMPNTRGMTQFADNGIVATKPYAASGNYINKMSDHCKNCHYDVKTKTDKNACPLNSLYWHFLERHQSRLTRNPRVGMIYRSWDNRSEDERQAILRHAEHLLANLDAL